MIIGISGKIGSGKDTVGKIIRYLIWNKGKLTEEDIKIYDESGQVEHNCTVFTSWQIKKFADSLKDMTCLLLGCTREELEDINFKNKELGEEWRIYAGEKLSRRSYILTPRLLMQLLGTECGREIIHPNIWVNALMSKYNLNTRLIWTKKIDDLHLMKNSSTYCGKPMLGNNYANTYKYLDTEVYERPIRTSCKECEKLALPNWIITDMRFPNELKAVEDKGGITIRVNRFLKTQDHFVKSRKGGYINPEGPTNLHESETALDNASFKYYINNNSTIEDLIVSVRQILLSENIL